MEAPNKTIEIPSVADRLISLILDLSSEQQKHLLELELKLSKERRRHTRKSVTIDVDFASQERAYRGFIQNLSGGGVYIQISRSFYVGQDVDMIFSFPGSKENVKIVGRIARVDDTGIGVEFRRPFG